MKNDDECSESDSDVADDETSIFGFILELET